MNSVAAYRITRLAHHALGTRMFRTLILALSACAGLGSPQTDSVESYRAAAEEGNAEAQLKLGLLFARGEGVNQDYAQSAMWFRKAAGQGSAWAQNYLGQQYYSGLGVAQDYAEAIKWFREAAHQGNSDAQRRLHEGRESYRRQIRQLIESSTSTAEISFLNRELQSIIDDEMRSSQFGGEAEVGSADAQVKLGLAYARGDGVRQDYAQAAIWFRRAAAQGNAWAQNYLGQQYLAGLGVPKDQTTAFYWLRLAAQQGNLDAEARLRSAGAGDNESPHSAQSRSVTTFVLPCVSDEQCAMRLPGSKCSRGRCEFRQSPSTVTGRTPGEAQPEAQRMEESVDNAQQRSPEAIALEAELQRLVEQETRDAEETRQRAETDLRRFEAEQRRLDEEARNEENRRKIIDALQEAADTVAQGVQQRRNTDSLIAQAQQRNAAERDRIHQAQTERLRQMQEQYAERRRYLEAQLRRETSRQARQASDPHANPQGPTDAMPARPTRQRQWVTETYDVTCGGSDKMFVNTNLTAFLVNAAGTPSCSGTYVEVFNGSVQNDAQFGLNGTLVYTLPPSGTRRITTGTTGTVRVTIRYLKE